MARACRWCARTPVKPKVRLGKGEKHNRKKEAVVTGLYTIAPHPRTPAEVVASLFHPERTPVSTTAPRIGPAKQTALGHDGRQGRRA